MKNLIATLLVGTALAVPANAQEVTGNADSAANSSAQNSLIFEGDSTNNTPAIGGWGGNNTAPCQAAFGAGFGAPGLGLGVSVPVTKEFCKTMVETEFLVKIMNIKDPQQRKLAITRACMTRGTIQETLVQVGVCQIKRKSTRSSAGH
jgi:hypothetical protein